MEDFRFGRAWSLGYRFLADKPLQQAILIIGVGIILPFLLQLALLGTLLINSGAAARAMPAAGAFGAFAVTAVTYVLQAAGACASWRFGLGREKSLGGALIFGLPAGLMLTVISVMAFAVSAATFTQIAGNPGLGLIIGVVAAVPAMIALASFATVIAAMIALGTSLVLILIMALGAATGNIGMAATLVGGSGAVVVGLIALSAVLLWLTARLSCTTSIMAARKSFNLFAAARDSWVLTWGDQWAILRYLALIGLCLVMVLFAGAIAVGAAAAAMLNFGSVLASASGLGVLAGLAIVIPLGFLGVMIPAGIYRTLETSSDDAAIFA